MKTYNYIVITALLLINNPLFSQKLEKLNKLAEHDFEASSFKSPIVLSNEILVTFPYHNENNKTGAFDALFSINLESLVRIKINKNDSCYRLLVLSKIFEKGIEIKSIKYYYKDTKSIVTRKLKESDIIITSDDLGYYLDFSKIIQDSSAIIDIRFCSESNTKQNIIFYLDKNKTYLSFNAQIYIPVIYFYDIYTDSCIKTSIKKDLLGPNIGYRTDYRDEKLQPKSVAESFMKNFNIKLEPVYCSIIKYSFKIDSSEFIKDSSKELINLKLNKIIETK